MRLVSVAATPIDECRTKDRPADILSLTDVRHRRFGLRQPAGPLSLLGMAGGLLREAACRAERDESVHAEPGERRQPRGQQPEGGRVEHDVRIGQWRTVERRTLFAASRRDLSVPF